MRRIQLQRALAVFAATFVFVSCRSTNPGTSAVKDGTEDVDVQMVTKIESSCATAGCHQSQQGKLTNRVLKTLARQTLTLKECLDDVADPKDKLDYCIQVGDEFNHRTGIYKAAANDAFFKTLFEAGGKPERFAEYQEQAMPPGSTENIFGNQADFDKVLAWITKQPPLFDGINRVRPPEPVEGGVCVERISPELTKHITDLALPNSASWVTRYKEMPLPMFGCTEEPNSFPEKPLACLTKFPAQDDWRNAEVVANGVPSPGQAGQAMDYRIRILREVKPYSSYWMRSSPDGRFVANGGYSPPGQARNRSLSRRRASNDFSSSSSVEDLSVAKRVIGVSEPYDPAFTPDNKSFVFVDKICPLKPLKTISPNFRGIDMSKPPCFTADGVGTYESVGQRVGAGDSFYIINPNNYSADDGGSGVDETGASGDEDPLQFGENVLDIRLMQKDATGTFVPTLKVPKFVGESQHIISASSQLVAGKFGPRDANDGGGFLLDTPAAGPFIGGYNIRFIDKLFNDSDAYKQDEDATRSTICLKGNKASMSYDDRFLVTHHFTDEKDSPEMARRSSDIYIYDLLKKRSAKITNMPKGYFALFPHFRGDGWIYFLVRHRLYADSQNQSKDFIMATDAGLHIAKAP